MTPESRQRKVERYEKYDSDGQYKPQSWYNNLKSTETGEVYDPVALQEELEAEVASYKQKPNTKLKDFMKKSGKFAIVRRKEDGVVLDIPVEHLEETLSKGFELITDDAGTPQDRDWETFLISS